MHASDNLIAEKARTVLVPSSTHGANKYTISRRHYADNIDIDLCHKAQCYLQRSKTPTILPRLFTYQGAIGLRRGDAPLPVPCTLFFVLFCVSQAGVKNLQATQVVTLFEELKGRHDVQ